MSYKVSVLLRDLEGFEEVKNCYYYNSKENCIYSKNARFDKESREKILSHYVRSEADKVIYINLSEVAKAFETYTQTRRESKKRGGNSGL